MSDSKTSTSTPGALRLQAYRQRLREGELSRVEILLPKTVCTAAKNIAKQEGTRYLETVSALAQLGLETYESQSVSRPCTVNDVTAASLRGIGSQATAAFNARTGVLPGASGFLCGKAENASLSFGAKASVLQSPLARFLKARKESTHD